MGNFILYRNKKKMINRVLKMSKEAFTLGYSNITSVVISIKSILSLLNIIHIANLYFSKNDSFKYTKLLFY